MKPRYMIAILLVLAAAVAVWFLASPSQTTQTAVPVTGAMHSGADTQAALPEDQVILPELSAEAAMGRTAFGAACASCHGVNAAGTDSGPPLIHSLYRAGHHPDQSFVNAARQGVRAHHWRFGDMPPVQIALSDAELASIVSYVREMQQANGVN